MENIKGRLPVSGQEGAQELKKIAMRFEDMIHTAATSKVCGLYLFLFVCIMQLFSTLFNLLFLLVLTCIFNSNLSNISARLSAKVFKDAD